MSNKTLRRCCIAIITGSAGLLIYNGYKLGAEYVLAVLGW